MKEKLAHKPELSVVIAVMNEEDNIIPMIEAVEKSLNDIDYELIYVDDGSTDGTVNRIKENANHRMKLIEFSKNFGQSAGLQAGIDAAQGDFIATLDGDLQNDPSDLPLMLEKLKTEDLDAVFGERSQRKDGVFLRKIPSKIANFIIRRLTEVRFKDYGCATRIFRANVAKNLNLYGELHRFIPVLAALQGAKISQIPVKHHERQFGKSKYNLSRTFKVISDLVFMIFFKKYFHKPMHLFGTWGFIILCIGVLLNLYFVFEKIMGHEIGGRPLVLVGILLIMAGLQIITFGIMSETQMRTYYESQNKRAFIQRRVYDFSKKS